MLTGLLIIWVFPTAPYSTWTKHKQSESWKLRILSFRNSSECFKVRHLPAAHDLSGNFPATSTLILTSPNPNPDAHRQTAKPLRRFRTFMIHRLRSGCPTIYSRLPLSSGQQPSYPKYDSNRSESSKDPVPPSQQPDGQQSPFKQVVVHSIIPTALHKPLGHSTDDDGKRRHRREEVPMKVDWRGGGKNVVLIRAGDDNRKGRQP